jgi:hypothetical protein
MPKHERKGLMFRFEKSPGEWGDWIIVPTGGGGGRDDKLTDLQAQLVQVGNLIKQQGSNSGKVIGTNGTALEWVSGGGGGTLTIVNKTSAYTVVADDLGKVISCSGTFTLSLTAAATLGAGFNVWVWNLGTGTITIDPAGSETIDMSFYTSLTLYPGEGVEIVCDGTNWQTSSTKKMRCYAENVQTEIAQPIAYADKSVAIGPSAGAYGVESIALGSVAGANGTGTVALGAASSTNDNYAIAIGFNSFAMEEYSCGIGPGSYANSDSSVALGHESRTDAPRSAAILKSKTVSQSQLAFSGVSITVYKEDFISSLYVLGCETTNATPKAFTTDGLSAATTNQIYLDENGKAYSFHGTIIARQKNSAGTNFAAWEIKGAILRGTGAASTTLGSYNVNKLSATAGASAWAIGLSADTTNAALKIEATGAASTDIRWTASINTSQVKHA